MQPSLNLYQFGPLDLKDFLVLYQLFIDLSCKLSYASCKFDHSSKGGQQSEKPNKEAAVTQPPMHVLIELKFFIEGTFLHLFDLCLSQVHMVSIEAKAGLASKQVQSLEISLAQLIGTFKICCLVCVRFDFNFSFIYRLRNISEKKEDYA